jgi:hypothetical protein
MWLHEAGYRFDAGEHVWGDRGDWNVTAMRVWAQSRGLWRGRSAHAKPSWGVVLNFGILDQHIGMVASQAASLQPVATIEGNTNGAQSRTGGIVMAHTHDIDAPAHGRRLGYVRPTRRYGR